jgi:hypothetical protein
MFDSLRARVWTQRQLVFAIIVIGILGLLAELLLLKHFESLTQWIPLIALISGLASSAWLAFRPGPRALRTFQVVMAGFVLAGLAGVYFHFAGNVEWALERNSSLSGTSLWWKALRGATPALAPGALAQLGLLGLAYTYKDRAANQTIHGDS